MKKLLVLPLLIPLGACGWWPDSSKPAVPAMVTEMPEEEPETEMPEEEEEEVEEPEEEEEETPDPMPMPDPEEEEEEEEEETPNPMPDPEDPEEEMEEEEEEETPPPPPMKTAFDYWEDDQAVFLNVRMTYPEEVTYMERTYAADGMAPSGPMTWEGAITGDINPTRDHLSDPRIELRFDFRSNSIAADISYMEGEERLTLDRYGARMKADGTFSSFDGLNAKGFDGAIYGAETTAAGNVSTPRVHGTYIAQ